jgi:hypothetical protein
MKSIILLTLVLSIVSCGPRRPGKVGPTGNDGSNGTNGVNGQDGLSLVVDVQTQVTTDGTVCKRTDIFQDIDRNNVYSTGDTYQNGFLVCNGEIGAQGIQGIAGQDGINGTNGIDGKDGINGQDGVNGVDGINGKDGLDADITYQVVEIIDPCGAQHPNGYDEVILKLGNGKYLASFSDNVNGLNTRLGVLPSGNYVTTDSTNCRFSI